MDKSIFEIFWKKMKLFLVQYVLNKKKYLIGFNVKKTKQMYEYILHVNISPTQTNTIPQNNHKGAPEPDIIYLIL